MKAIVCTRFGGPDDLELADIADPAAGPGEAVVKVAAAGLNFFDTLLIAGKYQVKPPFPFSPAAEFSGIVESVGAGVTGVKPGDRVMSYAGYGAARERVVWKADRLVKLPGQSRFRSRGGLERHLRHELSRAAGSRRAQGGRDAGRARRRRRHRSCRQSSSAS